MAVNIANELANYNINSHICVTRTEGSLKRKINKNIGYCFLSKKRTLDIKAIIKLRNYILKYSISLIHAHSSSFFIASIIKLLTPKVKIIWHDHYGKSEHLNVRSKLPLLFFTRRFKHIISVNGKLKDWATQSLKSKGVSYLPNFATNESYTPKETILKGVEGKRICCLANLRTQKDHITLLKAFKILKYKNWTLHLIGVDFNDAYSNCIKDFINKNELEDFVNLYGSCSDINYILSQATVGVLSSNSEGLPLALLEYGMAKLPVVSTNVGDCGKVIMNGKTGLVVKPNNPKMLADKLLLLMNDTNLRKDFGQNLYAHVEANFSKEKYIDKLIEIYNA